MSTGHAAEDWPLYALPKGTELHGFRLDRVIGRGGFGITYRAIDGIDQVFAIKECFPRQFALRHGLLIVPADASEAAAFEDCLTRFTNEARALKQLSALGAARDGVVKVLTFFRTNGTAYIVMEYISGQSFEAVIRAKPAGLPNEQLLFLLPRLLHAIGCVHDAGLLHRDIKPANILLREDGRPVLIDFGAVRRASHGKTTIYTQIYSDGYAPIEQFLGAQQGAFSDMYALGATFYRAIGGANIDAFTRHQAARQGQRDPLIAARQVGAGRYSPGLLAAIDAALAVEPNDRPHSVPELLSLLQDGMAETVRLMPLVDDEAPTKLTVPSPAQESPGQPVRIGPLPKPEAQPETVDPVQTTPPAAAPGRTVIGILFDIDALGGGFYGKAAYGIVFDGIGRDRLRKVRLYDGDVVFAGQDDARLYCVAIESEDGVLVRQIEDALASSTRAGLRPAPQRFLRNPALIGAQPLVFAGAIDSSGVLSGCDTPWIVAAWQGAVKATYDAILNDVGPNKFAVMKAVRKLLPNLGLAETQMLVERAPVALKVNLRRDEAAEIARKLGDLGAEVEIR